MISYGTLGGTSERGSCRPVPLSDESMCVCVCVCVCACGGGGGGGGGGGAGVWVHVHGCGVYACVYSYGVHN